MPSHYAATGTGFWCVNCMTGLIQIGEVFKSVGVDSNPTKPDCAFEFFFELGLGLIENILAFSFYPMKLCNRISSGYLNAVPLIAFALLAFSAVFSVNL